jgi:vibriolysin
VLLGSTAAWADEKPRGVSDEQRSQLRGFSRVDQLVFDSSGVPTVISGRLGHIGFGPMERSVHGYMARLLPLFRGGGEERFRNVRVDRDKEGGAHLRLQQEYRGLPIVGTDVIVHVNESTGEVTGINARFVPAAGLPVTAKLDSTSAFWRALQQAAVAAPQLLQAPELTYVVDESGAARLAYTARVAHWDDQGYQRDRIFADALDGSLVARHAEIWRAKYRKIYNAGYSLSLPGTLMFQEGGSSADVDAQKAYEYSGNAYDYFSVRHGRDSWNGSGGNLISSVHYGDNNAIWDGTQMAFGDGDGTTFNRWARALDVVAHEMTHGVTQASANLTYSNQPGALNEAMSDIFGAATEARVRGISSNTWKISEDIYTPGTANDALRYMNNPTQDGSSKDYYPERYTGGADYGGVHWNSGIANLAFYLLSQGGTHPRGKTSVSVSGIGMTAAENIFYRALTTYMGSSTNFEGARTNTIQAATDLHGPCSSQATSVTKAWDAVGVPRPSTAGDYEPNDTLPTGNPLTGYSSYVVGYLCTSGNADWYSVQKLNSYNTLWVSLYPPANSDYDLELWYSSPYAMSTNTGNGVSETVSWSYSAGTYYIKVFGKNGAYNANASYSLSVWQ